MKYVSTFYYIIEIFILLNIMNFVRIYLNIVRGYWIYETYELY